MRITPWHKPGQVDRGHAMSGVSCYGSGARVIIPDLPPQVCLYFEAVDAPKGRSHLQISMRLDEAHDLIRKLQNGITAHAELSASQEAEASREHPAEEFLQSTVYGHDLGRIVSSNDLSQHQIAEAQSTGRWFVTSHGLGFALLPWDLTTARDTARVSCTEVYTIARISDVLYRVLRDHEDGKSLCDVCNGALSPSGSWVLDQTLNRLKSGYVDPRDQTHVEARP